MKFGEKYELTASSLKEVLAFEGHILDAAKEYCLKQNLSGANFLFGVAILLVDTALVYNISKANLANFVIEVYNLTETLHKPKNGEVLDDKAKKPLN